MARIYATSATQRIFNADKLGVLCSRNAPHFGNLPEADVYLGGWHAPKEKEILDWLLKNEKTNCRLSRLGYRARGLCARIRQGANIY